MTLSDRRLIAEAALLFHFILHFCNDVYSKCAQRLRNTTLMSEFQESKVFSFKERSLSQLLRQHCVVAHKIPIQVIMSCWRKSYYSHAEQVSSPPSRESPGFSRPENVNQNYHHNSWYWDGHQTWRSQTVFLWILLAFLDFNAFT